MLFILIIIGVLILYIIISLIIERLRAPLLKKIQDLEHKILNGEKKNASLELKYQASNKRILELEEGFKLKDEGFDLLKTKSNESINKITSLYADFLLVQYNISSHYLKTKPHPAIEEAQRIQELRFTSKIHLMQYRQMLYKYETLLQLFPELSNYVEDFESIKELEDIDTLKDLQDDFDRVQFYISKEEYLNLNTDERNQLALDRYVKGKKTKWQIGRDYELFCGIEYERDGWEVEYMGIEKKLNDLGRDLIAIKNNIHHIIQCKYWAQEKTIHEKHITQIFGTSVEYGLGFKNDIQVVPVFITNITLSETAKRFAQKLGVVVIDNKQLEDFPRIKCNVNRDENGNKTKIYHLPFDQQYDKTKINKKDEFYAYTIKEAVKKGFRRAYRYYGSD